MEEDYQREESQFRTPEENTSSESISEYSYPDKNVSDTPLTDSLREKKEITVNQPFILQKSPELTEIDRELEELLKKQTSSVKVFGIGGGGGNTISRMREIGIKGGQFITINTDAQDLLYSNADYKILIGRELTNGLGAGSNPKIGEEAAHESEQEIKKSITGADMVFITCGLGGGTGTGAAPITAALAKKQGALTIGVVTLPFTIEGRKRIENAEYGLERMESVVDTLIIIPNDKLLEIAPELPLQTAFKVADEILTNAVKGITELVTKTGLVNLDFADVKTVMSNGGVSLIGMGEADSQNRAQEAVEKALVSPLLDIDLTNATGALVNIIGGQDMSLDEARSIIASVGERLSSDAKMIWGAQISPEMEKSIRVMIIVTGVHSAQITGGDLPLEIQKQIEISDELGIEFLE
jgi:cell division protein FtsZ